MQLKKLSAGLLALTTIVLFAPAVMAESDMINKMFHIKIKPGHASAFYKDLAEHAAWRREAGDPWTWWVHRVVNGVDDGDCIIRSGPVSWAEMEAYNEFGAKGSEKFWETVGEHVEDSHSWIGRVDRQNTRWHPEMDDVMLISVIHYHLKPGMKEAFGKAVSAFHEAIVEHDYPTYYAFDWPVNGTPDNIVTLALFFKDWSGMEPPEEKLPAFMQRVLGEDAQSTIEAFQGSVESTESMIVRYLPGHSIQHEKE